MTLNHAFLIKLMFMLRCTSSDIHNTRRIRKRKSWDDSVGSSDQKEKTGNKNRVDLHALLRTQAAISRRLSGVHENLPFDAKSESSVEYEKSSNGGAVSVITIHEKKWTDGSVSMDVVGSVLAKLEKDAMQRRRITSDAAAEALEEAIATESIVRNLSMFSELVASSKPENPLPTIDSFMSIYDDVLKSTASADSISATRISSMMFDGNHSTEQSKSSSTLWVEAALATNLEVVSLLTNEKFDCSSKAEQISKRKSSVRNSNTKVSSSSVVGTWSRGMGMNETVEFIKNMQSEMQKWFARFVEESLVVGFQVFGKSSSFGGLNSSPIAAILS